MSIRHTARDDSTWLALGDWPARSRGRGAGSRTTSAWSDRRLLRWTSIGLTTLILATGCRIESLPPSSSRADGGPVFARGVISHEARSQVRIYRDAAGCRSIQTTNRQFRVVTVQDQAGPRPIVLEETYDTRYCVESESVGTEALIAAWRPDSGQTAPLFQIAARGTGGTPIGNLYRLSSQSCCGSRTLDAYWSLLTGASLFASSIGLRELGYPPPKGPRFLAFHDSYSAVAPPEAAADSSVVGILALGDDRAPAARVAVMAERPEPFAIRELALVRGGVRLPDTVLALAADSAPRLAARVRLVAPASGREVAFTIPIAGDTLAIAAVRLPAGFRLERRR